MIILDNSVLSAFKRLKLLSHLKEQNKIIKTREEYIYYLDSLQKDIYISEELMKWALEE